LIFYSPTKPGGKYHFCFYLLCCVSTYAILQLCVHTQNTCDLADGFNPESEEKDHGNAVNNDNGSDCGSVDENDKDNNIDEHNPNTDQTASKVLVEVELLHWIIIMVGLKH
jgi:hypothetical protein